MRSIRIPLHSRKYPGLIAIVDESDFPLVQPYRWSPTKPQSTWYAQTTIRNADGSFTSIRMHRLILGLKKGDPEVDHIDGDGLNNRRRNMRACSSAQNHANRTRRVRGTSRYRGVCWYRRISKWRASITVRGKCHYLGDYESEVEAALAYDAAARIHHGEYGRYNFPQGDERSAMPAEWSEAA